MLKPSGVQALFPSAYPLQYFLTPNTGNGDAENGDVRATKLVFRELYGHLEVPVAVPEEGTTVLFDRSRSQAFGLLQGQRRILAINAAHCSHNLSELLLTAVAVAHFCLSKIYWNGWRPSYNLNMNLKSQVLGHQGSEFLHKSFV